MQRARLHLKTQHGSVPLQACVNTPECATQMLCKRVDTSPLVATGNTYIVRTTPDLPTDHVGSSALYHTRLQYGETQHALGFWELRRRCTDAARVLLEGNAYR